MAFASGVPLPGSVWDDYRTGTSLAGDIAQLIGGGLTRIGGIKRQEDKDAKDRAFREAEAARQASQFDRTLAQSDTHFNLSREDKYRLEAMKQAQDLVDRETGDPWVPPMGSVPDAKAAGAGYQAKYGADPMDVDSPATPQEKAALAGGGFTAPLVAPPTTALAGGRGPIRRAQFNANRSAQDRDENAKMAAERLRLSQESAARTARQEGEAEAAATVFGKVSVNPNAPISEDDMKVIARDPRFAGALSGLVERERVRKAAADAKAKEEESSAASAQAQIQSVLARAKANGVAVEAPEIDMTPGNRPPAKEIARIAAAVEKNYDDAFHAKMAEESRVIKDKGASMAIRARAAQHQVDGFTTELAARRKVVDGLKKAIAGQEADDPGSTKGTKLETALNDAIDAFNKTADARNSAYEIVGNLIGFENVVDPATGEPMAKRAAAKPWSTDPDYTRLTPEDKARWDAEMDGK